MNDENRKDHRRQKFQNKFEKRNISEEQRFLSRSKSERKRKKELIKEEEIWDDWEEEYK
jgi:hypothetical protein